MQQESSAPKKRKKDIILEKAAAMFREKGFAATSMRDLADAVGIEAASLYNHIKSKNEILEGIINRISRRCMTDLSELQQEPVSNVEKVERLIRFHIQMMIQRFDDYQVMTNEWVHLEKEALTSFYEQRRTYVQQMEKIFEQGIAAKELRPVEPYVAVLSILSSVRSLEFWHRSSKRLSAEEMEENMVSLLISGLKN